MLAFLEDFPADHSRQAWVTFLWGGHGKAPVLLPKKLLGEITFVNGKWSTSNDLHLPWSSILLIHFLHICESNGKLQWQMTMGGLRIFFYIISYNCPLIYQYLPWSRKNFPITHPYPSISMTSFSASFLGRWQRWQFGDSPVTINWPVRQRMAPGSMARSASMCVVLYLGLCRVRLMDINLVNIVNIYI